jgi:endonuclease V-like protein UPF0215 family
LRARYSPHVLGIDDGPLEKAPGARVPIIGVMMEGAALVEAIAITDFPVDGAGVTDFLTVWVRGLRVASALQGVILGGITIAGLGMVDVPALAQALAIPVVVVNRRDPRNHRLAVALAAAGLTERMEIVDRTPAAEPGPRGLWLASAGASRVDVDRLVAATLAKADVPEPLRVAHLIGQAIVHGQSRGRV